MIRQVLLAHLLICGCAGSPLELTPEEAAIILYTEEPRCAYESLGSIDTSASGTRRLTLKRTLSKAEARGATGIIIHDEWVSTGGPTDYAYTIKATAIRCAQ